MWGVEVQLTRCLLEVNFKLLPLYLPGMKLRYPLKVGQVGPRKGVDVLEKIIMPRPGNRTTIPRLNKKNIIGKFLFSSNTVHCA
jgi:hypothetical protein